jgi:hypothetical protein
VRFAFGLAAAGLEEWSASRGARHLMGPGGQAFKDALATALGNPDVSYEWQLAGLDLGMTRSSAGWFDRGDLTRCGHTNWELLSFYANPHLWSRTTWWQGHDEADNPLEQWP